MSSYGYIVSHFGHTFATITSNGHSVQYVTVLANHYVVVQYHAEGIMWKYRSFTDLHLIGNVA